MTERAYYIILLRAFIFLSSIFIIQFYFSKRLRNSLIQLYSFDKNRLNKIIITIIVFFDLFPVFNTIMGVYLAFNPLSDFEIPKSFVIDYVFRIPSWYVILITVQVFFLIAPIDFLFYFLKKLKINISNRIEIYLSKYIFYITIFFVAYIPLRSYYEFLNVSVEKRVYEITSTNKDIEGFKIAFISDIQADRFTNEKRMFNFINKLNTLNPDLVLIGGDFVTGDSEYIPVVASLVKKIKSNYGVYSCVGDHDFFAYKKFYWKSLAEIRKALKENGVEMINNGNVNLMINESKIKITFLSNTYVISYDESIFDSLATINQNVDLKILVTHQPNEQIALKAQKYGYNLYLAGHTHGGQVNFLFPFIKISPVLLETKFISGDFHFGNMLMIVTRGLGMSTMPIRYHSMPEISLIEIKIKHRS